MSYVRRGVLAFFVFFTAVLAFPSFAATLRPKAASRGMIVGSKSVDTEAAGIFFSGSFSYSVGGGNAVLKADNVTNPNASATGPLRFALWWTPTPYPSAGNIVATYDITPSLAANSTISPVNGGNTPSPFTTPPAGCYSIALVLEENVSGTWTERDYGNFSLKFDIGGGCITSYTASPTTVPSGSPSTLSWTTAGGSITSVNIDNGVGSKPANGSATVNPAATTTYTLSAFSTANSTPPSKQVTVTVGAAAPTATFSASPASINLGQSSTLTWTSSNATSISIDNGVGSQAVNGSVSVSPASTTTYTLTATGPGGTITKTATVTVTQPAPTISFSASPGNISAGQSSTLIWNTTNATSVTIDNGVGSKPVSGSATVSPGATTTYTLTATGPGGTLTSQATVTVSNRPSITFVASPASIVVGSSSTLTWLVSNSTSVTIDNGIGAQGPNGSTSVTPGLTTTYTLTATGPGGTSTASATVTVVDLPRINFSVTPSVISAGGSATLSWAVSSVDFVTIDQGVGTVFAIGTKSVSPTHTTVYTLTASNIVGTVSATVTVTVGTPPPPKHRAVRH
jgi:PKD repeat protein